MCVFLGGAIQQCLQADGDCVMGHVLGNIYEYLTMACGAFDDPSKAHVGEMSLKAQGMLAWLRERERERERERDRERQRETETETDRQTDRDRERGGMKDRKRTNERPSKRKKERMKEKQKHIKANRHTNTLTDKNDK